MLSDYVPINIKCGSGGSGAIDYKDSQEKAKPSGGNGGNGGSIKLEVSSEVHDLSHIDSTTQIKTDKGGDGGKNYRNGENGKDITINVPPGTRVLDSNGELLADLISNGYIFTLESGGIGGRGNSDLQSKSNFSPGFAESGEKKHKEKYILDLALISDIAIVGLPNAGKSSLLRSISNSKATVANYPFTTKTPNIGIVSTKLENISAIDLPGLIGEASEGKGLGKKILKHLLGAKIIIYVLDPSSIQNLTIQDQIKLLDTEINNYDERVHDLEKIYIVNKIDLFPDEIFGDFIHVSCKEKNGIDSLYHQIEKLTNNESYQNPNRKHYELVRPKFDSHSIEKTKNVWEISGSTIDLMCNLVGNEENVINEIMRRFDESGIEEELKSMGIKNGELIHIGKNEFVFSD
ncbi:MAG: Obg family GTPase CgtA [Actinomycetota bacterium]|nr:Obg family GTPase CgtA [Actinomycetota bacterium]